jgi:hypothetical protein
MTSTPEEPREEPIELADVGEEMPDEAPEADVLEQHLVPTGSDPERAEEYDVPDDADAADVRDQHQPVGDGDADDYR